MRIAFFDSGLGGITVLKEAMNQLPHENFIYYADTLHVPYGTKPKDDVKKYILSSVAAIMQEEVKALVIACNTATSIAVTELRSMYDIPIIGMEPAVKPAVEMNRLIGRRVLVMATPLTLQQAKYNELVNRVDDMSIVDSLPLPDLVRYCEALNFDETFLYDYFQTQLSGYALEEYGTIVLGCTHYPFYKSIIAKLVPPHLTIIDGSKGTVKRLQEQLISRSLFSETGSGDVLFLCSGEEEAYISKMQRALQLYERMDARV
ncbi:MAG: glutamate racemase [Paenibacillus sp.]|jgi:glutamate racemase|nr:glutamate racemase [Paenibacillus sp.]